MEYLSNPDRSSVFIYFQDIFHIGPITFETGSSYDCVEQSGWGGESTWSLSQASAVKYTLSYTGLLNTEGQYYIYWGPSNEFIAMKIIFAMKNMQ